MNDKKIIDTIRCLGIDMIANAQSGHSGIVLGAAPILYALYGYVLNYNPENPRWINRDRFVMSAGHGSALLYSTLFMAGYNISATDLKNFRKINSLTPGHPEFNLDMGVECTTGPLGQGVATAVGIALGERYLRELINKDIKNNKIIDYYTYCLVGDGDLMEGISYEALSFAGVQKLNKLIILYDSNNVSLDGNTSLSFNDEIARRFESINFNVVCIKTDNPKEIANAIENAKKSDKPSIIEIKTTIGKGTKYENSNEIHGKVLSEMEITSLKKKLDIWEAPFVISKEATLEFRDYISRRVLRKYLDWENIYNDGLKNINVKIIMDNLINNIKLNFDIDGFIVPKEYNESLRDINHDILNFISYNNELMMSGSADLFSSCRNKIDTDDNMSFIKPLNRNIYFGVREHAMGGILNGLALSNIKVFGSTFLTFSDYMRGSIRMSAMMNLPVTYIFTHDSVMVGEDGPTHQPIEQLSSLRIIPNLNIYRPCDLNEVIGTYNTIINDLKPSVIVLGKEKVGINKHTSIKDVSKGAYIVYEPEGKIDGVIISSGYEVNVILSMIDDLKDKHINVRVVSMPSYNLFIKQDSDYVDKLLPIGMKVIVIEPNVGVELRRFVYNDESLINITEFGKSGNKNDVLNYFHFDKESLLKRIIDLLK